MAATNHTRLRTARAAARQKSTDKSRGATPGKSGAWQLGPNRGVPPEAADPRSAPGNTFYQSLHDKRTRAVYGRSLADERTTMTRQSVAKAFGKVLRTARKERGLSQEELGLDADLDRTYTSLLERGLRTPTLPVLFALANILRVHPSQLVSDTLDYLHRKSP